MSHPVANTFRKHRQLATKACSFGKRICLHIAISRIAVVNHVFGNLNIGSIFQVSFLLGLYATITNGHSGVVGKLFRYNHAFLEKIPIYGPVVMALILSCIRGMSA